MSSDNVYRQSQQLNIREIPKFEFEINNQQLKSCIKQLNFNTKTIEKNVQRVKKQLDNRPTQNQITQALVVASSLIEIDPNLGKLLKSKTHKSELSSNPINSSACQLGRKINQISESVTLIHGSLKGLEKKVTQMEFSLKSTITQKVAVVQEQLDQTNSKMYNEFFSSNQKIEMAVAEFGDKIREVQTKTLWQINDCKLRLSTSVNEQFVKDSIKQVQGRMMTKLKEESIKQGVIDPVRIQKIQQLISKNQKQLMNQITQANFKIQSLKEHVEISVLSKRQNGEQKIQGQKRFGLMNNNLNDLLKRMRQTEEQIGLQKLKRGKLETFQQNSSKQIDRMNEVLKNLKIGDDFQKMLQKMDPHKICALDEVVNDLKLQQNKFNKTLELTRKQVDRLRSKTQFVGIITPNAGGGSKFTREDVQQIVHDYFVNNMFAKKIQNLQSQFLEVKTFPDMVNDLNKKISRVQKQTDTHNLIYELRGLQEYVKKQILIVNNRINGLQGSMNQDKRKRPSSAMQTNGSDKKLGSSLSYKKLTPVNCISCYQSPMVTPQRRNYIKKN